MRFFLLLLTLLAGCAQDRSGTSGAAITSASADATGLAKIGNIYFDSTVPVEDRARFAAAMTSLDTRPWNDPTLLRLMGLPKGDAASVRGWIEDRVQYLVGDGFNRKLYRLQDHYAYPEPRVIPASFVATQSSHADAPNLDTVMANVGITLYLRAKQLRELWAFDGEGGLGTKAITSPRAGLVVIGPAFAYDKYDPREVLIGQLGTILHEARHSDGHGQNAGFLHVKCPANNTYAGAYQCDRYANGPFEIEAQFYKTSLQNCEGCSAFDKLQLQMLWNDARSRLINLRAKDADPAPEGAR